MLKTSSEFFGKQARRLLHWDKVFTKEYEQTKDGQEWFSDGYLNACYNAIDRHAGKTPDKIALIYSGNETRTYTYLQCQEEIIKIANYLLIGNVKCVCIYMNMCAEAVFVALACARIGIIHNVIFGGFNAESLAMRVKDSQGEVIFTINKTLRDNKIIDYYSNVVIASNILERESGFLKEVVVFREKLVLMDCKCKVTLWEKLLEESDLNLDQFIQCKAVRAETPLFYLYTSGSTGLPKGLIHTTGGYLTYAAFTTEYSFDVDENSVFCCTADLGWITGHTYSVYGPLLHGCTTVIFDGVPTSPKNRLFQLIEKWRITHLYTSPTAIRMLRKILCTENYAINHNLTGLKVNNNAADNLNKINNAKDHAKINNAKCLEKQNYEAVNVDKSELTLPLTTIPPISKQMDSILPDIPEHLLSKQYEMSIESMQKYNPASFYRTNEGFSSQGSDLSSLQILGSVGEPINRDAYIWFRNTFGPFLPLIDTYWQTEAGGVMIAPVPYKTYPIPECACAPVCGMDPIIMHKEEECIEGQLGMLFFNNAWPGIARTIINDNARFQKTYFKDGLYCTGDEAYKKNGYIFVKGRADDVLKIAGHRLSTSEIESACCTNSRVFEAAAIAVSDEITGNAIALFICCSDSFGLVDLVKQTLRDRIGPVARVRNVYCVKDLPKTRTGKIMRRVLKNIIEGVELGDLSTCCNKESIEEIRNNVLGLINKP